MRSYVLRKAIEKRMLLEKISKNALLGSPVLEAGCGTGANSSMLAHSGYKVISIDNDWEVLNLAKKMSDEFGNAPKNPSFVNASIYELPFKNNAFSLCFSHGVLEHFSDPTLERIINEQMRVAGTVILSVPSSYFKEEDKMYGDERFLTFGKWRQIAEQAGAQVDDYFGYYFFNNKALDTINRINPKLLINHAPYIGLVISRRENQRISHGLTRD